MPSPFEAEIGSLLQQHGSATPVAEELLQRWRRRLLNEQEQLEVAQFLIATGMFVKLLAEIPGLVREGIFLPWAQFAESLGRTGTKPNKREIKALFDGAEAQGLTKVFIRSRQLDLYDRGFGERREQLARMQEEEILERRASLKDKLQFVRAQRLFSQEAEVIAEIQAIFPDETEIKADKEAYELRLARDIVARGTSVTDPTADLEWKVDRLTPAETGAKNLILESALALAQKDQKMAYDLAIGLHMMDFHADAIEVIRYASKTSAAEWLRLELMIRARQFVTALEEAARLELEHAQEPDTAFAATYAKARALYGLGQSGMAVELLRSLVRIRPQYRSAQSLLIEWSGGDV